jgi:hypothetical protein
MLGDNVIVIIKILLCYSFQLVSRAVTLTAEKRSKGECPLDFAAIHVAFNLIQSRINNFNLLVQTEPDLTSLLLEQPRHQLVSGIQTHMITFYLFYSHDIYLLIISKNIHGPRNTYIT